MNKKHVSLFASILVYNLVIFSSTSNAVSPATASTVQQNATPGVVTDIKPEPFSKQFSAAVEYLLKNFSSSMDFVCSKYNEHFLGQEPPKKLDPIKPSNNDSYFTKNQQYAIAAAVVCVVVAGIVYKYDLLASKNEESITAEEVQELVEMIVHNSAISKQDQLNKIFELLMSNGLDNIVVYNDHMFEVNDIFKVEIKGKAVKVTRV